MLRGLRGLQETWLNERGLLPRRWPSNTTETGSLNLGNKNRPRCIAPGPTILDKMDSDEQMGRMARVADARMASVEIQTY